MAVDKKHWYKNPNTTWNYRRKMSKWHFDTTLDDTNYEGIKMNFVRFKGDWSNELDRAQFKESPPMDLSEYLVRMAIQEMIELGIDYKCEGKRMTVDPIKHPKIQKIVDSFQLRSPYAQVLLQKPGDFFQYHIDAICYDGLDRHKVTDMSEVEIDNDSVRMFVAMEDWSWGQYLLMGNYHWTQWKAGDCMWFRWQDMPHGSANCGHIDRPMLKTTGKKTPEFEKLLSETDRIIEV